MIKLLGATCLVEEMKNDDDKTPTGIIIPGKSSEPTYQGKVIAVGSGVMLDNGTKISMEVNVGDTVCYTPFSGSPISHEGKNYIILNERDILCIIE